MYADENRVCSKKQLTILISILTILKEVVNNAYDVITFLTRCEKFHV